MNGISIHVLDNSRGRPGSGMDVKLEYSADTGWTVRGTGTTDDDGRIGNMLADEEQFEKGTYRLTFETGPYHRLWEQESFYPIVILIFDVAYPEEHYHIPLLLNPYGFTTYRGS